MNNSNPLIPQGSLLEKQNKGRARLKVAVFCVIACHVLFFGGLLLIGCGQDKGTPNPETASTQPSEQPVVPAPPEPETNLPVTLPPVPGPTDNTAVVTANTNNLLPPPLPVTPQYTPTLPPPAPVTGTASEYTVAKGDSFYTIGKKFGVSMKAIQDANPGVVPTRLKVGMKLQIPAPTAAPSAAGVTPTIPAMVGGGESSGGGMATYVVKSGDNLTKIASHYGTTIKAIRSANGLKTDRINVGQKLKVPSKAAPAMAAPIPSEPLSIPAPATTSAVPVTTPLPPPSR